MGNTVYATSVKQCLAHGSCFSRRNTNSSHLLRISYAAGTVFNLLWTLLHFILPTTLRGSYFHSRFTDEKSEAQRSSTICSGSHTSG